MGQDQVEQGTLLLIPVHALYPYWCPVMVRRESQIVRRRPVRSCCEGDDGKACGAGQQLCRTEHRESLVSCAAVLFETPAAYGFHRNMVRALILRSGLR